jgi:hypothetical protein
LHIDRSFPGADEISTLYMIAFFEFSHCVGKLRSVRLLYAAIYDRLSLPVKPRKITGVQPAAGNKHGIRARY